MPSHKIKAQLYDNALTTDNPNDYVARVISERSMEIAEICMYAATRGGADISEAAMKHAVELFLKEMAYQLCDGFSVNTGYFTATPQIRGVFDSPHETFDPVKHTILFQFTQGAAMRKELLEVEIEIVGVASVGLKILQVTDVKTSSVNDLLTPDRTLKITGNKLKIAGDEPGVGVFFVDQASGTATQVDPSEFVVNNPSELIVTIPALAAGTYKVQVATRFAGSGTALLKEIRTAVFDKELTVQ